MSSKETAISAETLRSLLHYDPETGVFTWNSRGSASFLSLGRCRRWNTRYAGKEAGWTMRPSRCNSDYRAITLLGRTYYAHRLAWLYMTGEWPAHQVDHKDLDGLNNRWRNLRPATGSQNLANRALQKNSHTKMKGVSRQKNGRYRARIHVRGKSISLGTRATKEEASALYDAASRDMNGAYARGAS